MSSFFETRLVGAPPDVVLALVGEFDMDGTTSFDEGLRALLDASPTSPVLDLGALTFLGSAGLGAIIRAHRANPTLVLRDVRLAQRRVFEIAGVDQVLRFERTPEASIS